MKTTKQYPILSLTIEGYGSDGEGVAHLPDGMTCFVTGALKGEICRVRLNKVGRSCAWGEVVEVTIPSPERRDPDCPHFAACGGCSLRHMSYEEELAFKKQKVQSYALSGHKIHGPKGVGALVLRDGYKIHPQMPGGGQQNGMRSGTENTCGIAGLRAAVENYPQNAPVRELKKLLVSLLREALPEMVIAGLPEDDPMSAGHILNVAFPPVRAETLLHALEGAGVIVGTGSACSSKKGRHSAVLTAMGLKPQVMESAIRISLCPLNTPDEMRYTAEQIIQQVTLLRRFTRR